MGCGPAHCVAHRRSECPGLPCHREAARHHRSGGGGGRRDRLCGRAGRQFRRHGCADHAHDGLRPVVRGNPRHAVGRTGGGVVAHPARPRPGGGSGRQGPPDRGALRGTAAAERAGTATSCAGRLCRRATRARTHTRIGAGAACLAGTAPERVVAGPDGRLDLRRGRSAGRHRPWHAVSRRVGAGPRRSRGRGEPVRAGGGTGPDAARARQRTARAGRPHRRGTGSPGAGDRRRAGADGRCRILGCGNGLPVLRDVPAAGAGRRADRRGHPRLSHPGGPWGRTADAGLPGGRHRSSPRTAAGGAGRVVSAL